MASKIKTKPMIKKRSVILIILFCLLACSTIVSPVLPTLPPVATLEPTIVAPTVVQETYTPVPDFTPTLTSTSTQAPTETAVNPPTTPTYIPMPTYEPTPTPIQTQTIIEVTPLGGALGYGYGKIEDLRGTYRPYNTQNVRWGPGLDYDRRYVLSAGQTVPFYAWVSELPFEAWLCLDESLGPGIGVLCTEAVALVIDNKEYGKVVFDD